MTSNYNRVNLIAVVLMFITTVTSLFFLPNTVINHFNGMSPDQTGSKYVNLIVPAIAGVLYFIGTDNLETKLHVTSGTVINIIFVLFAEANLWWTRLIFTYAKIKTPTILWILFGIVILGICIVTAISSKKINE